MSPFFILGCVALGTIILILVFVLVKNALMPQKTEAIPKLLKQGKTQNAIKVAKQIISKDSNNYKAHYYLGKAYQKENKTELALLEYKYVHENALFGAELSEVEFRKEYVKLLTLHNQKNDALKNYLILVKIDPSNAENYYWAGHLFSEANRNDVALNYMKKAVFLDKKNAKAHAELGMMLYKTKNVSDAKREIETALKLSPETYSSYYYLGKIQKDSKLIPAALKSFERAQRAQDVKLKAIIEHGSCYMLVNRYDNAALDFQRAIDLDRENINSETLYARYFLASCYEKLRKLDKAIEQWSIIYKANKSFRDVSAKLSEYKDLQTNDYLKDYLTCSNEEFIYICKNAVEKGLKMQIISIENKKWGCYVTAVNKSDESWMAVRKQLIYMRFYREPEPIDDSVVRQSLDEMKGQNCTKGYIFSSSGYTNMARHTVENRPLELIDKEKLESVLSAAGVK